MHRATLVRRDISRNISRHILDDGRVSLGAHLFGKRETSLIGLSPLMKPEGRAARFKAFSIVAGVGTMATALLYKSQKLMKTRRFTSLRLPDMDKTSSVTLHDIWCV